MDNILKNIKFVGIDLDDTLYDRDSVYKNIHYVMEKEVVSTGIRFSKFNNVFQEYSILEFDKYTAGEKNQLSYKTDRVKSTYSEFGVTISDEQALIFHSLYEYFRNNISLRPDALKFIDLLKEFDLKPFILTNGPSADQWKKIKSLELDKVIKKKRIFVSGEVGIAKPDQRIFEYVEDKLQISGESILYIGDHLENDVSASMNSGWNPIYFDFNKKGDNTPEITTVNNFKTLLNLFNKKVSV